MRSWKPRGPSPRLERKLFAASRAHSVRAGSRTFGPGWLVWLLETRHALGMGAGLALALVLLVVGSAWPRAGTAREGLPVLAVLSNQSWVTCLTLADVRHNSAPILGWTNQEPFPSTNRSLDKSSTNRLLPEL